MSATPSRRRPPTSPTSRTPRWRHPVTYERDGLVVRTMRRARRARRLLRARRARRLPVDRADDRGAGEGRRRRRGRACACRRTETGRVPDVVAGRGGDRRRGRRVPHRRRAGHRRDGVRHRIGPRGRRHRRSRQPLRRAWPSAKWRARAASACRRRSRGRRRWSSSPTSPIAPELAAIDVIVQAEHGPEGLAWLVTWSEAAADAITAAVAALVAGAPAARRDRVDARRERPLRARRRARAGDGGRQPHRARASRAARRRSRVAASAGAPRRCGVLRSVGAGVARRLRRRAVARAADARVGAVRRRAHRRRLHEGRARHRRSTATRSSGSARPSSTLAEAEGLDAHARARSAARATRDRASRASADEPRIQPRDDVALMEGYHSPQVDVKVRLNTNEAPEPPPAAFADRAGGRAAPDRVASLSRPRRRPSCAPRIADLHGVRPEQVFAANGSNEVLQTLCLTYGGHGRTAAVFEPTYALHSHIAELTGTDGRDRRADATTSRSTSTKSTASSPRAAPTSPSSARRTTRPAWSRPRTRCGACSTSRPGSRRRRGVRPVRAVVGARARRRRASARRHPYVLEDVVDGGGPPRLPHRSVVARRRARQGRAAVPPRLVQADRRAARARLPARDGRSASPRSSRNAAG